MNPPQSPAAFDADLLYRSECFAEDLEDDAVAPDQPGSRSWLYELTLTLAMFCLPLHMLSMGW